MRALRRLRIPTLLFVNKLDRMGADFERVVREIAERLTPEIAVADDGEGLIDVLAGNDDELLAAYVDGRLSEGRLRHGARRPDKAGSGASGAAQLGDHGRRGRSGGCRAGRAAAICGRGIPTVRSRALSSRSSGATAARRSHTCACSRARCARATSFATRR